MNTQLKEADIRLPELPWDPADLEPVISRRTIEFHYGKHHAGYVNKLNNAIEGTDYAAKTLEAIIESRRSVAEGVTSAEAVTTLAARLGVRLPVCEAVHRMVRGDAGLEAVLALVQETTYAAG